jgi:hypothetical protein
MLAWPWGRKGWREVTMKDALVSIANFEFGTQAAHYFLRASAIPCQI